MKKIFIFFFGLFSVVAFGQMKINQSTQIKEFMEVKKEFAQLEKTYQIQVYNGNVSDANNEMKNASSKFSYPSVMTFETPNYKFRTRLEAEKALSKVKNVYPAAFVIAPY